MKNPTNLPMVSFIMVNHNGLRSLGTLFKQAIESVLNNDYPYFELIIVDNASNDQSIEFIKREFKDPRIKVLVLDQNYWYAGGLNFGLMNCDPSSKYFILSNNDIVCSKNLIRNLVEVAEIYRRGVVSPKVLNFDGSIQWMGTFINKYLMHYNLATLPLEDKRILCIPAPVGPLYLIRRDLVPSNRKLFPEDFKFGMEEVFVAHISWTKGFPVIYAPEALVWHKFGGTIRKMGQIAFFSYHNCKNTLWILIQFTDIKIITISLIARFIYYLRACIGHMIRFNKDYKSFIELISLLKGMIYITKKSKCIKRVKGMKPFYFPHKSPILVAFFPRLFNKQLHHLLYQYSMISACKNIRNKT